MENNENTLTLKDITKLTEQVAQLLAKNESKTNEETSSKEINELATALAKAQGEFKIAGLSKINPFFKSKYADLADIVTASRPALSKYGLSVIQPPEYIDEHGESFLKTILLHSSGQWIMGKMRITPPKTDVQSLGSYITYLRRYSYSSLIGVVAADEDDDGEASVRTPITAKQLKELEKELTGRNNITKDILSKLKLNALKYIPQSKFMGIMSYIKKNK